MSYWHWCNLVCLEASVFWAVLMGCAGSISHHPPRNHSGLHCGCSVAWQDLIFREFIVFPFKALYYAFLLAYHRTLKTRKPSKWINPIHLSRHRQSSSMQAAVPPYVAEASSRSLATTLQQQTSISTIISASPSQKSQNTSLHLTRSRPTSTDYHTPLSISLKSNYEAEQETAGTLGRIRSLVSQPREVDHAAVSAHSDNLSDSSSDTHYSNDDSLNLDFPPVPTNIGYNEFGEPYPPEESIPMLNGFVRRMPTIESMGSRELASTNQGSSVYSGSAKDRFWVTNSGSRSPTRVSLSSPIDAPSRPSSLSMRVSDIIGSLSITGNVVNSTGNASEVGELIRPVNEKRNNPPSPSRLSHCINSPSPHPSGTQNTSSQSSWASTVPTTYYTATMSSRSSVPYSVQEEDPDLWFQFLGLLLLLPFDLRFDVWMGISGRQKYCVLLLAEIRHRRQPRMIAFPRMRFHLLASHPLPREDDTMPNT